MNYIIGMYININLIIVEKIKIIFIGYVYMIGDCGGVMVESKCLECNVVIGGLGYWLWDDN